MILSLDIFLIKLVSFGTFYSVIQSHHWCPIKKERVKVCVGNKERMKASGLYFKQLFFWGTMILYLRGIPNEGYFKNHIFMTIFYFGIEYTS